MKEIIIEVPDEFGKTLKPWKANTEIKGELVRCKDCKWYHQAFVNERRCVNHDNDFHNPGWFCADGERR